MEITIDSLRDNAIVQLLEEHLADMYATSPAESVHALDADALKAPDITFWCARENGVPLGCIALKTLSKSQGEIKSMRTTRHSRGKGVASALLDHLLSEAIKRGISVVRLETGTQPFFAPARRLYKKFGFDDCEPFADYQRDPNSAFMALKLTPV